MSFLYNTKRKGKEEWNITSISRYKLCNSLFTRLRPTFTNNLIAVTMASCLFLFPLLFVGSQCTTLNDSKVLMANLLANYDPEIRPIANQSSKLTVSVSVYVKSIQEFNEVKETFLFTAVFVLVWQDVNIMWNPAHYGGLSSIMLSIDKIWVPQLVITTSSSHIVSFGQDWQKVLYLPNGIATWSTGGLVRGTCSINVRNYPFDSQKCSSHFSPGPYYAMDVDFSAYSKEVNMSIYAGNVVWDLHQSSVSVYTVNGRSQLDVTFHLRRKSAFVVINVLIPLGSLSFLNILVFFLVPCSGERVSYSVTVLLAIAVFMTIISDTLTKSSEPVPLISYKLMGDMIISALITVVTILNLALYHKPDSEEVPEWLKKFYKRVHCRSLCPNKINPEREHKNGSNIVGKKNLDIVGMMNDANMNEKADIVSVIETDNMEEPIDKPVGRTGNLPGEDDEVHVTWKQISFMVDTMSIVIFTGVSCFSFLAFVIYLYF